MRVSIEKPEVGGIWPEVGGKSLPFLCCFIVDKYWENDTIMYLFIDMKYAGGQNYEQ